MSCLLRYVQSVGLSNADVRQPVLLAAIWQRTFAAQTSTSETTSSTPIAAAGRTDRAPGEQQHVSDDGNTQSTSGRTQASTTHGTVKPTLVEKVLNFELAAQPERLKQNRRHIVEEFQRHSSDVGSPEVMVAVWTQRIRDLAHDFQSHRKNYHQMRDLELMFNRRRRMLRYMRHHDFEAYCFVIHKLGLKDLYQEIRAEDRYPEGSLHKEAVDDRVLRFRFAYHPEYRQKKTNLWKRLKPKLIEEDSKLAALK